jgi:hypothetical protein
MLEYRWYFLPLTFLLLGGASYLTFSGRQKAPAWQRWLLAAATLVSLIILASNFLAAL